jgi:NAD-dependent deacetylase
MKSIYEKLKALRLSKDAHIVVLTGAGVSAESGVPTFRGEDGLWKKHRAQELATPEAFRKDPATVWEWYDYRRQIVAGKDPNPAHLGITRLDEALPDFVLITQNVDGLHARAGTKRIIELHGNIFRLRCTEEGHVIDNYDVPLPEIPPRCRCGALLRPDVVWFGEPIPEGVLTSAFEASRACGLMLVIGTSAVVQPAASMPLLAKQAGASVIEVNPDPTPLTPYVDISLQGKAGEIVPVLVDALIKTLGFRSRP